MKIAFTYENHVQTLLSGTKAGDDLMLYALVDAGQLPGAERSSVIRLFPSTHRRNLFENSFAQPAAEYGPLLLACHAGEAAITKLDQLCHRWPVLSYLHSKMTLDELLNHLQSLLKIQAGDDVFLLRYVDVQTLPALWQILSASQRAGCMARIERWFWVNQRGELGAAPPSDRQIEPEKTPLKFTDEQVDSLLEITRPATVVSQLRYAEPDFARQLTVAEQIEFVHGVMAQETDVDEFADILARCIECWQTRVGSSI